MTPDTMKFLVARLEKRLKAVACVLDAVDRRHQETCLETNTERDLESVVRDLEIARRALVRAEREADRVAQRRYLAAVVGGEIKRRGLPVAAFAGEIRVSESLARGYMTGKRSVGEIATRRLMEWLDQSRDRPGARVDTGKATGQGN